MASLPFSEEEDPRREHREGEDGRHHHEGDHDDGCFRAGDAALVGAVPFQLLSDLPQGPFVPHLSIRHREAPLNAFER